MKALLVCITLSLSIAAYGQEPGAASGAPVVGETQPDTTGERLKQLLRTAHELEQAGKEEQAATTRQMADRERQALVSRLDALQAEIEQIRQATGGSPQVIVHLKVVEVSLTKLSRLGFNLAKLQAKSVVSVDAAKDDATGGFSVIDDNGDAYRFLEAMRKDNLAHVLAEPSLVAISGRKATFTSGGELLIPRPQKDGSQAFDRLHYGTQVELTPEVLSDRTVRLAVHCRIADLDYANPVRIGKDAFPGLLVREFTTGTKLKAGQTLVFSGLRQVSVETSQSAVPIASSIPYVGAAFKTIKEERNEKTMLVLIQPEIVQPIDGAGATAGGRDGDAPSTVSRPTESDARR